MTTRPRNYWVLRGLRGAQARTRLLDYYAGQLEVDDNVGQGPARPATQLLYLEPFAIPLAADHIMQDSATVPAWNALGTIGGTASHVQATPGAGNTIVDVKSYKAPRISRITLDNTGERRVSRITGLPYLHYNNTTLSIPFGKALTNDTVQSVFSALAPAYTTPTTRARLTPERS